MENVLVKDAESLREEVREKYASVAKSRGGGCGCACGPDESLLSQAIGYSDAELSAIPAEADLGVGCGNPTALASIRPGEVVVDLGSGAGIDCFLAANAVGPEGHVIGVDMTDEMLELARTNAAKGNYQNVEFRKGFIEDIPVESNTADLVISNCVINLSSDKRKVFDEVHRVLKPGGRMTISDIVTTQELPEDIQGSIAAYVGCVAGAMTKDVYLETIRAAGFSRVDVLSESSYGQILAADDDAAAVAIDLGVDAGSVKRWAPAVLSIKVQAIKNA